MNVELRIAVAAAFLAMPLAAAAQDFSLFEEEKTLPKELYAPTVPGEPLPGPRVVTRETCVQAPEVCKARKEELRRKRQACRDNPANCSDPALAKGDTKP